MSEFNNALIRGSSQTRLVAYPSRNTSNNLEDGSGKSTGGSAEVLWNDTIDFTNLLVGDSYTIKFYMYSGSATKSFLIKFGTTSVFSSGTLQPNGSTGGIMVEMSVTKHSDLRCSVNTVLNGMSGAPGPMKVVDSKGAQYCSLYFRKATPISFELNSTGTSEIILRLVEVITTTSKPSTIFINEAGEEVDLSSLPEPPLYGTDSSENPD